MIHRRRSVAPLVVDLPDGGEYTTLGRVLGEGGQGVVYRFLCNDPKVVEACGSADVVCKACVQGVKPAELLDEYLPKAEIRNAALYRIATEASVDGRGKEVVLLGRAYQGTLFAHGKPCDERFVARMGVELAQAIVDAEAHQMVHRDIKSENIFLVRDTATGRTRTVLGDWGMRVSTAEAVQVCGGTTRVGAPEQFDAPVPTGTTWSGKSDVYAAMATQHETLTGSWWRPDRVTDQALSMVNQPDFMAAAADAGIRQTRIDKQWVAAGMADHIPRRDMWERHIQSGVERRLVDRISPEEYLLNGQGFLHAKDRDLLSEQDLRLAVTTALDPGYTRSTKTNEYLMPVKLQAVTALACDDRIALEDRRKLDAVADRILDRRRDPAFLDARHKLDRQDALAAAERRISDSERFLRDNYGATVNVDQDGYRKNTDLSTWEVEQDRKQAPAMPMGGP